MSPELIARTIGSIYEAAYDPTAWQANLANICNLFHGSRACLVRIGPDLSSNDAIATSLDPTFQRRYVEEHAGEPNVFSEAVFSVPVGLVYNDRTLVGPKRLRRSRFWNEWMAPQDMYGGLGSKLLQSGPSIWFFDVQRGRNQAAFEPGDADLMRQLVPHLSRAAEISRGLHLAQTLASAFSFLPFGVILVDGHMQVICSNPAAAELLLRPDGGLQQKAGQLFAADAKYNFALRQLVEQACSIHENGTPGRGGDLTMRTQSKGINVDLSISVGPIMNTELGGNPFIERCATVFVREIALDLPAGFHEQIRVLFNLSSREANIAASLASGRTLRETALDLHIAYSTVRSNLEVVFQKTATRQQSQLVALLKNVQPLMRR